MIGGYLLYFKLFLSPMAFFRSCMMEICCGWHCRRHFGKPVSSF